MSNFDIFLDALSNSDFDERPATLREFIYDDKYLGFESAGITISDYQMQLIEAMTTIYRYDTLVELWGYDEADRLRKADVREVLMILGKGGGKDLSTSVGFAYIAHLLLCLRDPAQYYGKPPGDSIHLLNIAINAAQAKNVFFTYLRARINKCPWFNGKYHEKADSIEFDKNITAHSGHSEREAWEGYNCRTPDVEILTRTGWKTYDQLEIGEDVYTLNHETGAGEWNELEHVLVREIDEDIIKFKGPEFTATSTKGHRWAVVARNGARVWKTTETLAGGDQIPLRAPNSDIPRAPKFSDSMVEAIARRMVGDTQDYVEPGLDGATTSAVERISPDREPTYDFVNSLTQPQLELFIHTCMLGEGRGSDSFVHRSRSAAEIFAYACILSGRGVLMNEMDSLGRATHKMSSVTLRRKVVTSPVNAANNPAGGVERTEYRYTGTVWCPTVKNGTWLCRENGSVYFTGNCLVVVLDEISGFATAEETTGAREGKTADAIHKMYRASVTSRFAQNGKVVLLSWPRYSGDYISTVYDKAVQDKVVERKSHTFKLHKDLADGVPGNEFTVEWDEDHIVSYTRPGVFALKRASWEVNPTKSVEDYAIDFFQDPQDSLGRFACNPPEAVSAFFKDRSIIDNAFPERVKGPFTDSWQIRDGALKPDRGKHYYMHVDLGYSHDRAAVAMAHVEDWVWMDYGGGEKIPSPIVKLDAVRWWTPTSDKSVNFQEIEDYITGMRRRGFKIDKVTFDRWSSVQFRQQLENNYGIQTGMVSVAKPHYEDFMSVVVDNRLRAYNIELARSEMAQLQIIKGNKVDHPRKSCFVGETRIPLLDGTRPQIKDLDGKEVWVYSAKPDGTIVPGRARGRRTKQATKLLDVELDNGYIARCTPDHRWMLRNGEYKEAQHLRPGIDRLMPIRFYWPHNGGYEAVSGIGPGQEKKETTHRIVASYLAGREIEESEVVHHLDHVKTNNHPENLKIIPRIEHSRYHTEERHAYDTEWRRALSEGTIRFNKLESTRRLRSESMRSRSPEWYLGRARKSSRFRSDITIDSLIEVLKDPEATNANMASKIIGCGRNVVIRVLREHGYSSWEELQSGGGDNHRVRSLSFVDTEPTWVYDLEVDEWHNFALTGGVFVHNSKDVSDAIVGAVFGAVEHATPQVDSVVTIRYLGEQQDEDVPIKGKPVETKPAMPDELASFLERMTTV